MAREICIKSGNQYICKASPIRNCSCDGGKFDDPFYEDPEPQDFPTPAALIKELTRVLGVWEKTQRNTGDLDKLLVLWKISQLLLLKEIEINKPFIITGM